jgi:hypothetical protein
VPRHTFEIKTSFISHVITGPVNKIAKFKEGEFIADLKNLR